MLHFSRIICILQFVQLAERHISSMLLRLHRTSTAMRLHSHARMAAAASAAAQVRGAASSRPVAPRTGGSATTASGLKRDSAADGGDENGDDVAAPGYFARRAADRREARASLRQLYKERSAEYQVRYCLLTDDWKPATFDVDRGKVQLTTSSSIYGASSGWFSNCYLSCLCM